MKIGLALVVVFIGYVCADDGLEAEEYNEDSAEKEESNKKEIDDILRQSSSYSEVIPVLTVDDAEAKEEAARLYDEGMKILNKTGRSKGGLRVAYKHFKDAAALEHVGAMEQMAIGALMGDGVDLNLALAKDFFQRLADRGNPRGQMGLGFLYATGLHVNSSQAHALLYLTFAALGGDHFAQMALAYRYWSGLGVEASCETALTYYQRVAKNVADQVSVGGGLAIHRIRLVEEVEYMSQSVSGGSGSSVNALLDDDLIQYYQFLADKGDVNAQVGLGQIYFQGGRGIEVDYQKALHYLQMAAKAGNSHALAYLGKMYVEGSETVPADNSTALQYFQRAAQANNPIGMSGLGLMYMYGRGVDQDYTKALKYFTMAADQGYVEGQLYLGIMYFSGLGVKRDYKLALKNFNLASQHGSVLAFYNLAQMHATGIGVLRSCNTASELYKNVAERGRFGILLMEAHNAFRNGNFDEALVKYLFLAELGYEVAQSNAAFILDQGLSSLVDRSEDLKRALLQWQRSANQGNSVSRVKVGDYHYYGMGTDIDYSHAAQQYRIASDHQHNAQAIFNLGYMYEKGMGIKRDIHLAKRHYDLAAEASSDAIIPVTLALCRLSFYFIAEYFRDWSKMKELPYVLSPEYYLGSHWDLYLLPVLMGALFLVIVQLQQRRLHQHH
jgi:SEL1 protein